MADETATLLLGLDGVNVVSAQVNESGKPMPALVTACEDALVLPGMRGPFGAVAGPGDHAAPGSAAGRAADEPAVDETRLGLREHWVPAPVVHRVTAAIPPRTRLTSRLRTSAGTAVADADDGAHAKAPQRFPSR